MNPTPIPYARHSLDEDDIAAVVAVLRSEWLTTRPEVGRFERGFASAVSVAEAVAVSSGTAALHVAMAALKVGPGDEVLVPALTFAATANAVADLGARPVFVDVDPDTLLIDLADVDRKLTARTRAIVGVDFAGQPADYDALREITAQHQSAVVADACHALGATDHGRPVGSLADLSTFSFHAVKPITTGEGGMITTNDPAVANRMRSLRNHGINLDHRQRDLQDSWFYKMEELGRNYRLSDIQAALGRSQLSKLERFTARRQEIARRYDDQFASIDGVRPLASRSDVSHAYHLYIVRMDPQRFDRGEVYRVLRDRGVRAGVHYIPVYWHPYYQERFGMATGICPNAEAAYQQILSLPIYAGMSDEQVATVGGVFCEVVRDLAH